MERLCSTAIQYLKVLHARHAPEKYRSGLVNTFQTFGIMGTLDAPYPDFLSSIFKLSGFLLLDMDALNVICVFGYKMLPRFSLR